MGDVDRGGAGLAVDLGDLGAHRDALLSVEVRKRLVHQEDADLADDGAADGDTLPLAAGERAGQTVKIVGQTEDAGRVLDLLVDHVLVDALQRQAVGQVVIHAHLRVQGVALEHHGDLALARAPLVGALPVDQELALADVLQTGDHAQRGGFAAARGADEDDKFALLDFQVEIVHRVEAVGINLVDVFQGDVGHGGFPLKEFQ